MVPEKKYEGWYTGDNERLFRILSIFLNLSPDYVTKEMIDEIAGMDADDRSVEFAYASIAAAACGLDVYSSPADKEFFRSRFLPCFRLLDEERYLSNPYYRTIKLPEGKKGSWTFENRLCRAYEAFVYDDPEIRVKKDGGFSVLPRIGFFRRPYTFPAVLENGREWMTLMPNETNTSEEAVKASAGRVLTYGLGLGYFAYMAAIKPEVTSVTVVERSEDVVRLFCENILPQIPERDKISVVVSDAFEFAESRMAEGKYDFVFTDLWHDPSDGVELWLRMKEYEHLLPDAKFIYWIEKTLELYY